MYVLPTHYLLVGNKEKSFRKFYFDTVFKYSNR